MKYAEITAVKDMDRDEMTKVLGGNVVEGNAQPHNCFGAFNVEAAQPGGQANNPETVAFLESSGIPNLGQLIKAIGGNQVIKDLVCPC